MASSASSTPAPARSMAPPASARRSRSTRSAIGRSPVRCTASPSTRRSARACGSPSLADGRAHRAPGHRLRPLGARDERARPALAADRDRAHRAARRRSGVSAARADRLHLCAGPGERADRAARRPGAAPPAVSSRHRRRVGAAANGASCSRSASRDSAGASRAAKPNATCGRSRPRRAPVSPTGGWSRTSAGARASRSRRRATISLPGLEDHHES